MWEMHLTESDARGKTDASLNWGQRDLHVTLASSSVIKWVIIYRTSVTSHSIVLMSSNTHVSFRSPYLFYLITVGVEVVSFHLITLRHTSQSI
jgi:hypothetical protein